MSKHKYRDVRIVIEICELADGPGSTKKILNTSVKLLTTMTSLMSHDVEDVLTTSSDKDARGKQITVRFNGRAILKVIP